MNDSSRFTRQTWDLRLLLDSTRSLHNKPKQIIKVECQIDRRAAAAAAVDVSFKSNERLLFEPARLIADANAALICLQVLFTQSVLHMLMVAILIAILFRSSKAASHSDVGADRRRLLTAG